MRHTCRQCNSTCDKIFSLVETVWCPISTEILERNWRLICEQCYRAWKGLMINHAKKQLEGVTERQVQEAEHDMVYSSVSANQI